MCPYIIKRRNHKILRCAPIVGKLRYVDKVTDFSDVNIAQLKNDFRSAMNQIAEKMSDEEQQAFIEESNQVFMMNNLIVNSVGGQNQVIRNLLYKASAVILLVVGVAVAYKMHK